MAVVDLRRRWREKMTPEGKVKRSITKVLKSYPRVHYTMPVPSGFGQSSLDYVGCAGGLYFEIEAKRPGGKPTDRQLAMKRNVEAAGGRVFLIDGPHGLKQLIAWLEYATCSRQPEAQDGRSAPVAGGGEHVPRREAA
jgi:hypothetical protein